MVVFRFTGEIWVLSISHSNFYTFFSPSLNIFGLTKINPYRWTLTVDLSIIMCTFNEVQLIEIAIKDVLSTLQRPEEVEIIIIDNNSNDGTKDILLNNIADPRIKVLINDKNLGKGGSIKRGISNARGKYIIIHDPDMEYRAEDIWKCYYSIRDKGVDCVLGSRLKMKKPKFKYYINLLGVKFLSMLISKLYSARVSDAATAMKI